MTRRRITRGRNSTPTKQEINTDGDDDNMIQTPIVTIKKEELTSPMDLTPIPSSSSSGKQSKFFKTSPSSSASSSQDNTKKEEDEDIEQAADKLILFNEQYEALKEYRKKNLNAPVDTMGCSVLADSNADEKTQRFQVLVSLMLSSQTKDQITAAAVRKLQENNVLSVAEMNKLSEKEIQDLIYPVGFYKRKSTYLKKVCKILLEKYDSDIPKTVKELCDLPGVGPKMAYLCMSSALKQTVGIGVDTHVHRISNRLEWVNTKTPEQTRMKLEEFVPQEEWDVINHMLVGFGQTVCKPVSLISSLYFNIYECKDWSKM
ncbi:predicted protein [Naegleria gruberi]|uniref:Endonuclease III homolog n=1 Tax=Naegleria gruberi TaxID=5762 RepID=D2VN53_NAEGR|nr:uncharacterized protein NAEGRDRAFT_70374 [Naegleria gruberi]EFC41591.1 predicted protein [Naegleria gruberi]|eukprot:XP_002674335.1 predicted protein [Naegleria gruberi strain NEG-M]